MDAPPDSGEDLGPFIQIAEFLKSIDLTAPEMEAVDEDHGFILMEDLGDGLLARVVSETPSQERPLYQKSVNVLAKLHAATPPPLPRYGPQEMAPLAGLALTWYAQTDDASPLVDAVSTALRPCERSAPVVVLRDYHAENLLHLPDRNGVQSIGLLDFQDAALGHSSYDLASLLGDARRDVSPTCKSEAFAHFIALTDQDSASFARDYAAQSAQRNLRILGVFARLALRDGKPHYLPLLPRVWANLLRDLEEEDLAELKRAVIDLLPPPTEDHITRLEAQCAQPPTP